MSFQVLQRHNWHGDPKPLGDCFRLHKESCGRSVQAACQLWSHRFDWESRLVIDGAVQRMQVCRSQEEVFDTFEEWKRAMIEKAWN
jgi:hypothetical protein